MDQESGPIHSISEPGIQAEPPLAHKLRREVAALLNRTNPNFPGAQPVSFARRHLEELRQQDYYVCEKSDGIRYLLYLTTDEERRETHYLIDRKNNYWWIQHRNLHFPLKDSDLEFHTDTLIDGELVFDDLGNGRREPRFLVFDCLVLDGRKDLLTKSLDKRLGYFREHIMVPYKNLFARYPDELRYQAFKLEMKEMQVAYGIEMMFREVLPNLKHGNDGLIFTCRNSEYRHGTDQNILKWKPAAENTIDFRLRLRFHTVEPDDADRAQGITEPYIDYDSLPVAEAWAYNGDSRDTPYTFFNNLYITEEEWETLKGLGDPLVDRIVECGMDEQGRWTLHRFRDDKGEANHISTVNSVMQSIQDSVSESELLDAAKGIKDSWKARASKQR